MRRGRKSIDIQYRTFSAGMRASDTASRGRKGCRCDNHGMSQRTVQTRPIALAVWLVVAGIIGWIAAFALTVEKFHALANPDAGGASCDFSIVVQCTANLDSWQGSVFGFPNPIIGLTAWVAPIVVGMAVLAGARFARWFWWTFFAGIVFAFGFVIWLISQSIFVLGTLCPWCMVTWSVTIPTFFAVGVHLLRSGVVADSPGVKRAGAALTPWVPLMAFVGYAVVLLVAQVRLNAIPELIDVIF